MTPSGAGPLVVELLPARQGDAIVLSWGPTGSRHRMLVDGGPAIAYDTVRPRLVELAAEGSLELLVLTHIDGDHIEGTILLTNDAALDLAIDEVWFNGSGQLVELLGPIQGEIFGALLSTRDIPWNRQFSGSAVRIDDSDPLPVRELPGGLRLTVLGPDRPTLLRLRDEWLRVCAEEQLAFGSVDDALQVLRNRGRLNPADTYLGEPPLPDIAALAGRPVEKDNKIANKSSIVLLAEYGDVRVLLAGDATPGPLVDHVKRLLAEREVETLPLTAFKLPHHGSARNVTRELVGLLPADHYLFSSDGTQFHHPDDAAVATVLEFGKPGAELVFNYRNPRTLQWEDSRLQDLGYRYQVRYPAPGSAGVSLIWPERAAGGPS